MTVRPLAVGSDFVFEPSDLTFTPDNWATPQTITVTAEFDDDWVNDTAKILHSGGARYGHNRRTDRGAAWGADLPAETQHSARVGVFGGSHRGAGVDGVARPQAQRVEPPVVD